MTITEITDAIKEPEKIRLVPVSKVFALVDKKDYEKVSSYKWYLHNKRDYAVTFKYIPDKSKRLGYTTKAILMHRLLLSVKRGQDIDHINGNGLDNRKENLRVCTRAENIRNQIKRE